MKLVILGISGSIGKQSVDVIKKDRTHFSLIGFSVGQRTRCISFLIKAFPEVRYICIKDNKKAKSYEKRYPNITFFHGDEGLLQLIEKANPDMVENALVGFVGLRPTVKALELNMKVALANKESLVVGGELINNLLKEGKGTLYPIDSEHVALDKCLNVDNKNVEKLIITASGGSFRNLNRSQLVSVTPSDALKHPNWKMGNKITIDSATLVNKCFEVIEAHYLFNYSYEKIDVVLHDESCIHSMVKYNDGNYRVDISKPDMRVPIKYALYERMIPFKTYITDDYHKLPKFHFRDFDINRYPVMKYAEMVINKKGTYGAIFNASNEVAVYAFLEGKIPFLEIEEIIDMAMKEMPYIKHPTLSKIVEIDKKTRDFALDFIKKGGNIR